MSAQKPGRSRQDYGTPADFMAAVEERFGHMAWDLAATPANAKARKYITPEQDAFRFDWCGPVIGGNLWLNPPFGEIGRWAERCAEAAMRGAVIHFLTPASVGSNWFFKHVHRKAAVLFLSPRLTFEGESQPYPKDCILSVFGEKPGYWTWRWRP